MKRLQLNKDLVSQKYPSLTVVQLSKHELKIFNPKDNTSTLDIKLSQTNKPIQAEVACRGLKFKISNLDHLGVGVVEEITMWKDEEKDSTESAKIDDWILNWLNKLSSTTPQLR